MMVSGIPTSSGYEERIRFAEMEVVDRGAQEQGLVANVPEGNLINGWDVNVAGVRMTAFKKTMRTRQHAEFLLRVKEAGHPARFVARRYGDFSRLHKHLRLELPGKILPPLPRKNKAHSTYLGFGSTDSDDESISSVSTRVTEADTDSKRDSMNLDDDLSPMPGGFRSYLGWNSHKRTPSTQTTSHAPTPPTPSPDVERTLLLREDQRISLRAFLRNILQNERISKSAAMRDFLTAKPVSLTDEELVDIEKRRELDQKRVEEGKKFYEIARKRAAELDVHMERFRRDIVERSKSVFSEVPGEDANMAADGLRNLFKEVKIKTRIQDLDPDYRIFCEWLRIEVAAVIYHLFLAEDNAPELFAQLRRIHSLVPYTALKNVIRFANPAAVMKGVLDLFLAQPFGARSLTQRVFSFALNDGIRTIQKQIGLIAAKTQDTEMVHRIKSYTDADEGVKQALRHEAAVEQIDLVVVVSRTDQLADEPSDAMIGRVMNGFAAWNASVESDEAGMQQEAEYFANLKQLLKLCTRERDKAQMLAMIEEPVTLKLFRDLFTIFYEPLVRVYKSANVYNSVTDFASFLDDTIKVVEAAQQQDISADPNQTVQAFIDLCARHEDDLYKFIHEVHIHDNGLFDQLMGWLENILEFLRHGPNGNTLDMNALFQGAVSSGQLDQAKGLQEVSALVEWQVLRKRWHNDKTRRKMAAESSSSPSVGNPGGFRSSDFGLNELDLQDMGLADGDDEDGDEENEREEDEENTDPIAAERHRREKVQAALRSRAGEPQKPEIAELPKLMDGFVSMLRMVLA